MIKDATYLHDYLIEVVFDDDTTRVIDLEGYFKNSTFPLVHKFAPLNRFKEFYIDSEIQTICWGDNECDIDPFAVYEGKFDAVLTSHIRS